jgi:hypothetical protein
MVRTLLVLIVIVTAALDCTWAGDQDSNYPKEFLQAARAFQSASPTNRYREAELLQKALPTTRITSVTYSGTASNFNGRGGRFITRDLDKPSFPLHRKELFRLLGAPSLTNSLSCSYAVASGAGNRFPVYLGIDFHRNYVVNSTIYSVATGLQSTDAHGLAK